MTDCSDGIPRRQVLGGAVVAAAAGALGLGRHAKAAETRSWAASKLRRRIRDLSMAYHESGSGDPIVFLHGNPTSSYLWRNVIPHLAHLGRCIAPDLIGMGDSAPLADSGPGNYTFQTHRDYLFALLDSLDVRRRVTLVVHDWGSGLGFHWAQQNPERIRALVYMEAIVTPPGQDWPAATSGPFATLRSAPGEQAVLEQNMFVEQMLIAGLGAYLSPEDQEEYRRPYRQPGESRRPTLEWPRELPLGGEPARNDQLVREYSQWLASDERIPKLFIRANPGAILAEPGRLAFVRGFRNQTEVSVFGSHYVQEISPHAIGRSIAQWLTGIA